VAAPLKRQQTPVSEYREQVHPRRAEARRHLALRVGASVWIVVVLSTLGTIYLVRKVIHGLGAEVSIFDGFDTIAYIGLAVVLAPSMAVMLVSSWLDGVKESVPPAPAPANASLERGTEVRHTVEDTQ
jgi:hypothetical protein